MSKWSEARDYEERLRCECEGSTRSIRECSSLDCEYRKIWKTTIEALEIAERLEDIESIDANSDDFIYDRGYARGYNQALADVRGDVE